jgi:hypothetical protein
MRLVCVAVALAASCATQSDAIELTPPPAAQDVAAPGQHDGQLFLAAPEAWALLTVDVHQPPFALRLPPALSRPGMVVSGIFRICVFGDGVVSSVDVRKSADRALVDRDWIQTLLTWRYRPLLRDGKAVPFCSDVPLSVTVK